MSLVEGSIDTNAILVGDWSEVSVLYQGSWYYIGNVPEGALELSQEIYDHVSTAFPRKVDLRIPIRADMKFSGQIEEVYAENVRLIIGQEPNDSSSYIYYGALSVPRYFTFRARRKRPVDNQIITVVFWKASSSGLFQLGGSDEAVPSPMEVVALDDSAGAYGGSTEAPLGYLYIPPKTT